MTGPAPASPCSTTDDVVGRFLDGDLPAGAWTHEAHLLVCRHLLQKAAPDVVLADLRTRIEAHNERVGVRPGGGYHETITRYFVLAVAAAPGSAAAVLADPACQRGAPRRHWSPSVLASDEARARWVPPDRAPLPWPTTV